MKTKLIAILVLAACMALVGCGKKDDEINAVMKDLNTFTSEMVAKVQSASDPATGVVDAQKYLDSKKADIKKKMDSIKNVRGFQVSDETKKTMTDDITKNVSSVATLQITYVGLTMRNAQFKANLEKLVNDYQSMITG
jgi:Tfp pilus assembly protein PilP